MEPQEVSFGGIHWFDLSQGMDSWHAVIYVPFPKKRGEILD